MIKNFFLVFIILLVAIFAVMYIYKAKKRGEACIGCPYVKQCSKKSCNK